MKPCVIKVLGSDATGFAAVDYNERKVAEGEAEFLLMKNFGELDKYQFHAADILKGYFQKVADRNDKVQHPQLHIMVSYPGKPTLEEKQKLIQDFEETLNRLGYKGQPVIIYAHNDTDNWHLHAVTVRVQQDTGRWIDNSFEGVKARSILDQLRGVEHSKEVDKMLDYNYTSKDQFLHILRANGYHGHVYEESGHIEIYRGWQNFCTVSLTEIETRAEENKEKNKADREAQLKRMRQIREIISKYRDKSLKELIDVPSQKKTKKGKHHTVTSKKSEVKQTKFRGSDALELTEMKKAQFKQFLVDLKRTAGIEIIFHKDDNGKVRGYSVVDNAKGFIFNGSSVMKLDDLLNGKNMTEEIIPEELALQVTEEHRFEKTAKQTKIDPSNVYELVLARLDEMGIKFEEPKNDPKIDDYTAQDRCEHAIEQIINVENAREKGDTYLVDELAYSAAMLARESHWLDERCQAIPDYCDLEQLSGIVERGLRDLNLKPAELEIPHVPDDFVVGKSEERCIRATLANLRNAFNFNGDMRKEYARNAVVMAKFAELEHQRNTQAIITERSLTEKAYLSQKNIERETATKNAITAIRNYTTSKNQFIEDDKEIGVMGKGIVARCIENGKDSFNVKNLEDAARTIADEIGLSRTGTIISLIISDVVNVYLEGIATHAGGGGGGNNDLPKNKDDQWDRWKSLFGMHPPRRSKGGQKL